MCILASASQLNGTIDKATLIDSANVNNRPYCNTGLVYTIGDTLTYMGSGYAVNNRAIVTAAHVVFDNTTLSWRTGTNFDRAYNQQYYNLNGTPTSGSFHLDSFSTALQAYMDTPNYIEGTQDGTTFNSDIAILYTLTDLTQTPGRYTIARMGEPSIVAENWQALILGYPMDSAYISEEDSGKMFQTGPRNWSLYDAYGHNNGYAYIESAHAAFYVADKQLVTYHGNSGGPLFVYDPDDSAYTEVGICLGGNNDESATNAYFRIIDETAEELIEQAIESSGSINTLSPTTLAATGSKKDITLTWSDTAKNESGWQIRRNDGDAWKIIATAKANATSYVDTTAQTGITYQYALRAVSTVNSVLSCGPWCKRSSAAIDGANTALAHNLRAPYLCVTSGGDAPFYTSSDGSVRSGKILNNQNSTIEFTVTGPGTFTYSVATSTEGAEYDKVIVALDGTTATTMGGTNAYASKTINISKSGSHTITFTYAKNEYSTEGDDCIYLKNVNYYCSNSEEAVQGGKITSGQWRYSPWLGHYYDYKNHWIYSFSLGYLYVFPATKSAWANEQSHWVYFDQGNSDQQKLGWCWIGTDMWPWIWSYDHAWVYYAGNGWMKKASDNSYIEL